MDFPVTVTVPVIAESPETVKSAQSTPLVEVKELTDAAPVTARELALTLAFKSATPVTFKAPPTFELPVTVKLVPTVAA